MVLNVGEGQNDGLFEAEQFTKIRTRPPGKNPINKGEKHRKLVRMKKRRNLHERNPRNPRNQWFVTRWWSECGPFSPLNTAWLAKYNTNYKIRRGIMYIMIHRGRGEGETQRRKKSPAIRRVQETAPLTMTMRRIIMDLQWQNKWMQNEKQRRGYGGGEGNEDNVEKCRRGLISSPVMLGRFMDGGQSWIEEWKKRWKNFIRTSLDRGGGVGWGGGGVGWWRGLDGEGVWV